MYLPFGNNEGSSNLRKIYVSEDFIEWQERSIPALFSCMGYANGVLVGISSFTCYYSYDFGLTWNQGGVVYNEYNSRVVRSAKICYNGGNWYLLITIYPNYDTTSSNVSYLLKSSDLQTWTQISNGKGSMTACLSEWYILGDYMYISSVADSSGNRELEILESNNSGSTWYNHKRTMSSSDFSDIGTPFLMMNGSKTFYSGSNYNIVKSVREDYIYGNFTETKTGHYSNTCSCFQDPCSTGSVYFSFSTNPRYRYRHFGVDLGNGSIAFHCSNNKGSNTPSNNSIHFLNTSTNAYSYINFAGSNSTCGRYCSDTSNLIHDNGKLLFAFGSCPTSSNATFSQISLMRKYDSSQTIDLVGTINLPASAERNSAPMILKI